MVWFGFYLLALLLALFLYVPGLTCLSRLPIPNHALLAIAPCFSIVLNTIFMSVMYSLGMVIGWVPYILVLVIASMLGIVNCSRSLRERFDCIKRADIATILLYLAVSLLLVTFIYVKTLDGPASVIPFFDNASTLSETRSLANSGLYGPIVSSNFLDTPQLDPGSSYYPSVLHAFSALLANSTRCNPSEALNISVFVALCPMLSLSVRSLIKTCFPSKRIVELCGAFAPYAFVAFPWGFILFGSLLTNLFSVSLVPAFVSVFAMALFGRSDKERRGSWVAVVLCGATLVLTHPGSMFMAGVICVPAIVNAVWSYSRNRRSSVPCAFAACCVAAIVIAAIWVGFYSFPPIQGTVSFTWVAFMSAFEAFSKLITLSFADCPAQLVTAFLVTVGLVCAARRGEYSIWLFFSALFAAVLYFVDVTIDGSLKQLLTGFWYTDSRRVAAIVVIPLMPFFSYGLARVFEVCQTFISKQEDSAVDPRLGGMAACMAIVFAVYGPSVVVPGSFTLESAISYVRMSLASLNELRGKPNLNSPTEITMLDKEETSAGEEIKAIVGNDTVLNNALDGSAFLYGLNDVRMFYRSSSPQAGDEPYGLLREHVNEYVENPDVRKILEDKQIKYVLQLDAGIKPAEGSTFYIIYNPEYWRGIQSVNSSTPGFELAYSRGDIRLYRLTEI